MPFGRATFVCSSHARLCLRNSMGELCMYASMAASFCLGSIFNGRSNYDALLIFYYRSSKWMNITPLSLKVFYNDVFRNKIKK